MSTTFVLVHGACHGGWSWRPVVERLRARGHAVYTPTLPGLNPGDRRADIHLSDTVDYLVDYVEGHELADIVLVGHSWGGFPVSGAAIRLATRISRLVYWSAFVPLSGESMIDLCPPASGEMFRADAATSHDNSVTFPFDIFASTFMQDASPETQHIVYPLLERHPFHTMNEPLELERIAAAATAIELRDVQRRPRPTARRIRVGTPLPRPATRRTPDLHARKPRIPADTSPRTC